MVRDQLFPQKPPGSRFRFSRTGVQPSPGSSTIELPSAFAESGAYPPDREPPGSPRQCSLPLACRHPSEGHQIGARKRRTPENTILSQPYCRRVSTNRSDREGSQLAASLEGEPGPTPAGKTLPHSYPETRFRRERARDCMYVCMYGHTCSKSMDQPGKVASPARGQLNRKKKENFPVRVRARGFGLARRVRQSRPASACLSPCSRLSLVLTYGIPPEFRGGIHLFIYNRHTPSG